MTAYGARIELPRVQALPARCTPVATIVAVDCADGALLAGDRVVVRDGTVAGTRRHVFDLEGGGAAAVGDDPAAFGRRLESAIDAYAIERGSPGLDAIARMAADAAEETGVEALVVGRDGDGRARARSVSGGTLPERLAAIGSAAQVVLGRLEAADVVGLDAAESAVREAFRTADARDPGTGADVDVVVLRDAG